MQTQSDQPQVAAVATQVLHSLCEPPTNVAFLAQSYIGTLSDIVLTLAAAVLKHLPVHTPSGTLSYPKKEKEKDSRQVSSAILYISFPLSLKLLTSCLYN